MWLRHGVPCRAVPCRAVPCRSAPCVLSTCVWCAGVVYKQRSPFAAQNESTAVQMRSKALGVAVVVVVDDDDDDDTKNAD